MFQDPLALSIIDHEHDETEERWITLGQADNGQLLVIAHTFQETDDTTLAVRIISARKASQIEQKQYEMTK